MSLRVSIDNFGLAYLRIVSSSPTSRMGLSITTGGGKQWQSVARPEPGKFEARYDFSLFYVSLGRANIYKKMEGSFRHFDFVFVKMHLQKICL
jgi:hypothetical protein